MLDTTTNKGMRLCVCVCSVHTHSTVSLGATNPRCVGWVGVGGWGLRGIGGGWNI